jgi:hypothetical protein
MYIYDLGDPAKPVFIRQFGLVGQQPDAPVKTAQSCTNAPGPSCYEGVTNPPGGIHQIYSAGVNRNRVYLAYGVDFDGVFQILDRQKLLDGCKAPSPHFSYWRVTWRRILHFRTIFRYIAALRWEGAGFRPRSADAGVSATLARVVWRLCPVWFVSSNGVA